MSIFDKIKSAIFGGPGAAAPGTIAASATGVAPSAAPAPKAGAPSAAPGAPMSQVDVAAVMDKLADKSDEDLDWRKSIVDLMKLLDLDSGLSARRELAKELNYTGDTKDSGAMNVWLHKQVMAKLAANGGVVPADLKD
jgi:hypothetical protein